MKTIQFSDGQRARFGRNERRPGRAHERLNARALETPARRGFTLIELLVVIAIIGILAAILLPVLARVKQQAKEKKARLEISEIVQAIDSYNSTYSRFPVSTNAMNVGQTARDFTYGATLRAKNGTFDVYSPLRLDNAEVIAILMDKETYPNGNLTINQGHVKNPKGIQFLNATLAPSTNSPGVGPDGVYRDPWGNPYIISMDLNYDDRCFDVLYSLPRVSSKTWPQKSQPGYNGLDLITERSIGNYEANSPVMVWSAGPDGLAGNVSAVTPPNKDNILSWTQ